MKSLFRCPVCGGPLDREERVYRCADRHSYDIAKEGYTYLLPPNQKHSADPGDDKAMSAARRDFLSKKYYAPLLNTLCSRILPLVGEHPVILDAGCGEGYYTAGIRAALTAAGKTPAIAGIDISKSILRLAAKREKQVEFAVASCYHLPFADETADLLLDCFSRPLTFLVQARRPFSLCGTRRRPSVGAEAGPLRCALPQRGKRNSLRGLHL
ncbi:MAG: putative RNA methyltransferase [Dysosmobacter sp.]